MLGILSMPKLVFLFLLVIFFACTSSKEVFDTSPLHDKELLAYSPFRDLIDAVLVFENKYGQLPKDLRSLKNLSREDYINICITDGVADSILVDDSNLNLFLETETEFIVFQNNLEIQYTLKNSSFFSVEWMESLYSKDFDGYLFHKFNVMVSIEKGNGTFKFIFGSNKIESTIEELSLRFSPGEEKMVVKNNTSILNHSEPLCL